MKTMYQQKNKGFTLIEMLVAVLIFTVSLTALMTITSRGLRVSNEAQRQVIADYLAIEAIEAVRNMRDSVLLHRNDTVGWVNIFDVDGCLSSELGGGGGCIPTNILGTIALHPCEGSTCRVYYDEVNFAYQQFISGSPANYQATEFERRIRLIPVPENHLELIVRIIVTWDGGTHVVDYTENLFLWL